MFCKKLLIFSVVSLCVSAGFNQAMAKMALNLASDPLEEAIAWESVRNKPNEPDGPQFPELCAPPLTPRIGDNSNLITPSSHQGPSMRNGIPYDGDILRETSSFNRLLWLMLIVNVVLGAK